MTGVIRDRVDLGSGEQGSSDTGADVFLLALSLEDGARARSWRFGAEGDQTGRAVAVDPSGSIILFGTMEGSIDFGSGVLLNTDGNPNLFAAKVEP